MYLFIFVPHKEYLTYDLLAVSPVSSPSACIRAVSSSFTVPPCVLTAQLTRLCLGCSGAMALSYVIPLMPNNTGARPAVSTKLISHDCSPVGSMDVHPVPQNPREIDAVGTLAHRRCIEAAALTAFYLDFHSFRPSD